LVKFVGEHGKRYTVGELKTLKGPEPRN
ncbi:MAG: hypothetical protein JWO07_856, partial [Candidatus Saccharibacteria bacterium]|nr:hypothetical protein [Candidatus Saccharibacteria bacterium]